MPLGHLAVAGGCPAAGQAVDQLLRDAAHDLSLADAGERSPEVVEGVQSGAALDGDAADIAFGFDQRRGCAVAGGRKGSDHAPGAATGDDDVELTGGKVPCGFRDGGHGKVSAWEFAWGTV